jgi:hypothetical protein
MSTFRGLAIAIIKALKANNRNTKRNGFNFARTDFCDLKPFSELIFKVAVCCFRFKICHTTTIGSSKNNQKNSGFKKEMSFIIIPVLF